MTRINPQFAQHLAAVERRERMKAAAEAQAKQAQTAAVFIEYMKAHEKSQKEVILAWDQFVEARLRELLEVGEPFGLSLNHLELEFGPVREDFSQDVYVAIDGEKNLKISRNNDAITALALGEPVTWEFTSEIVPDEAPIDPLS